MESVGAQLDLLSSGEIVPFQRILYFIFFFTLRLLIVSAVYKTSNLLLWVS